VKKQTETPIPRARCTRRRAADALLTAALAAGMLFACGCEFVGDIFKTGEHRFLDPSKMVFSPADESPVRLIYSAVGEADPTEELPPNATLPRPEDLVYEDRDYVIGPNDVLDVSILDLLESGLETTLRRQVTISGYIDLPLLPDRVKAEGYTKDELTEIIKRAYSPHILRDPTVAVTVAAQRQNTFSILGAVAGPGTYTIPRKDLRLLGALSLARGVTQANIRYILVIRHAPAIRRKTEETKPRAAPATGPSDTEAALRELGAALATAPAPATAPATKPATVPSGTDAALRELGAALTGRPATAPATAPTPTPVETAAFSETSSVAAAASTSAEAQPTPDAKSEKWVYTGGRWIRVIQEAPTATKPSGRGAPEVRPVRSVPATAQAPVAHKGPERPDPYGWQKADRGGLSRIIAIDLERLRQGDRRMNIIVRDNDVIQVPTLRVGEFYVMGEVQRPGVYTLTGRRITLKMALAAAGNLGPLAWPENSVLVRRIGNDKEQTIPLNLESIFAGQEPDFFLKANDVLAVGTHWKTSFMAVVRNAFRMTYGFGLIYDRNFADPLEFLGRGQDHTRFTRW